MDKQQLISDILAWSPVQERKILEAMDTTRLKDVLAHVVTAFTEEQEERVLQAQADIAANRFAHQLGISEARKPLLYAERLALEKENRAVFSSAARELGFSGIEANYSVLVQALGELTVYGIQKWIAERPETLVPATPAEIEQRRLEAIAAHNQMLRNASPLELRELVRQEAEARRTAAHRTERMTMIETTEKRDAAIQFTALPTHNAEGVALDARFLKALPADSYRQYVRKYGSANITARLNGVR